MRRLNDVEAEDVMRWLGGDQWPAVYGSGPGAMGYDPSEGWDAAIWVLHAIYEWPDLAPRLTWSELTQRDGIEFWAVDGRWPDRRYTPQSDWADSATMPAFSGPRIGPTTEFSWPASILPPPQGSLDEEACWR